MIYPELIDFIKKERAAGSSMQKIREDLLSVQWDTEAIDEHFASLEIPTFSTRPIAVSYPLPTKQNSSAESFQPYVAQELKPSSVSTPNAFDEESVVITEDPPRKGKQYVALAGIIFFSLVGAAGAGYFAWNYYDGTLRPKQVFAQMPRVMSDVTAIRYTGKIKMQIGSSNNSVSDSKSEDFKKFGKEAAAQALQGVELFLGSTIAPFTQIFSQKTQGQPSMPTTIPSDLDDIQFELRVGGIYEKKSNDMNFSSEISANITQGDYQIGLGGELRSIDTMYYFRIIELPMQYISPFLSATPFDALDVTGFLKNWYSIRAKTLADLKLFPEKSAADIEREATISQQIKDKYLEKEMFDVVSVTSQASEYVYTLKPRIDDIMEFTTTVYQMREDRGLTKSEEESIVGMRDILEKAVITARVQKQGSYLTNISIEIPNYEYSNYAVATTVEMDFTDFNTASLTTPSPVIEFDDQLKSWFGDGLGSSSSKARDTRSVANTKQIQLSLEQYYDFNGTYPAKLSQIPGNLLPSQSVDLTVYSYVPGLISSKYGTYHLGVSVDPFVSYLASDADCNSLVPSNCAKGATYSRAAAFDGSDKKGCKGEPNRACYDVKP